MTINKTIRYDKPTGNSYIQYTDYEEEDTAIQIDPPGCRCTQCTTGLYRPLDEATGRELLKMLEGAATNATGFKRSEFKVVLNHHQEETMVCWTDSGKQEYKWV